MFLNVYSAQALACRLCVCSSFFVALAQAQAQSQLGEVTVTGHPLGRSAIAPASSLGGPALLLRGQSTLGQTLDGEPGLSSSYFGPNASRPVIRGLDGERIRILSNGSGLLDVSGLSPDHAVSLDPLSAERIEVLRGPGALLYGGSAVGGVVNVLDNRIARTPQFGPEGGLSGKADLGWASGSRERSAGVLLEGGHERMQWHVDALDRQAGDVAAPAELACDKGGTAVTRRRLCNSASQAQGGAVGASWFGSDGYLGASVSSLRSRYGVVAEDDVQIGMRSQRYAFEGERRKLHGLLSSVRWSLSHSDYAHTEFEDGQGGSRFATRGSEFRLQARHKPLAGWEGVWGLQLDGTRFAPSATTPEDLYAPASQTRQAAVFLHEERKLPWGLLSAGARLERVGVQSLADAGQRFATGRRDFTPTSLALGLQRPLGTGWTLGSHLAYTERAPKAHELYAHGPHVATGSYEVGNPALGQERSAQADLGLQWRGGADRLAAHVYVHRFGNFITPQATGELAGEDLPEYRYAQVRAQFQGAEVSGRKRLLDGAGTLDLGLRADLVRAHNRDTGEPLPRIAPWRVGASLDWSQAAWTLRLGADHAGAQRRVPTAADGTQPGATAAYTLLHAAASYRQRVGQNQWLWYARLENLSDRLAYSASSVLTTTAPGRAPLPGRSLKLGLQLGF